MYTLEDYEKAKEKLRAIMKRWENYSGNNPDKYQTDLNLAHSEIRAIEAHLKATGVLPLSEKELLYRELDRLFPNANSNDIVEHAGKKYQRKFSPAIKSRSGRVREWDKFWVEVKS